MSSAIPRIHIDVDVSNSCTNCCAGLSCCIPRKKARVVLEKDGRFRVISRTESLVAGIRRTFSSSARELEIQANQRARRLLYSRLSPEAQASNIMDPESASPLTHEELHMCLDLIDLNPANLELPLPQSRTSPILETNTADR